MTHRIAKQIGNCKSSATDTPARPGLDQLYFDQSEHAPAGLRGQFFSTITPAIAELTLTHLSRVRFTKRSFKFDPEGRWAVVVPILNDGEVWNWAAFASDDDDIRGTYRPGDFAVGLGDSILKARLHPKTPMLVHHSIWAWLQDGGGRGLLPVNWRATALFLMQERYNVMASSRSEGELILDELERATRLPDIFYRTARQP
jgi:hypothetical protein